VALRAANIRCPRENGCFSVSIRQNRTPQPGMVKNFRPKMLLHCRKTPFAKMGIMGIFHP
jgi:hypothetical protein